MNSKAIVPARSLTPTVWQMISSVAPAMYQARLFGVSSPEQAAAIMLKGYELGLGLATAFEFIHVINGKPSLSPAGALALIQSSGELEELEIKDNADGAGPTSCRVRMKRSNGHEYSVEFTMADAIRTGQVKPGSGWEKYPANMLRWRAIGYCSDVLFGDILAGMKRADELGLEITAEGEVIDAESWPTPEALSITEPQLELTSLVAQYGAEAVFNANNGKIPADQAELQAVAAKLGGQQ